MSSKLWSPKALRLHLTLAVLLAGFAFMFWWQLHRALGGNELSWAYTVEWPVFAGYAVFMWWRLLHDDMPKLPRRRRGDAEREAETEEQRQAYNAYLAALHAADELSKGTDRSPSRQP